MVNWTRCQSLGLGNVYNQKCCGVVWWIWNVYNRAMVVVVVQGDAHCSTPRMAIRSAPIMHQHFRVKRLRRNLCPSASHISFLNSLF